MGEVLTQIWLRSIELFDKEVNAQKESLKKYFRGSRKLPQVCDENETKKQTKKQRKKMTCA